MIQVVIHGTGRMASAIAAAAQASEEIIVTALVGPAPPAWETRLSWYPTLAELPSSPDLLIDFTLPEGTRAAARWSAEHRVPLLSGVTGLGDEVHAELAAAAEAVPVLWSPNLSVGVNLLADLAARASAVMDDGTPVLIRDVHHQWKKDAPSGTALMLGARIGEARGGNDTGLEYSSIRRGEVIGEHTVTFEMAGEEIELVHRAHDRGIYAIGALQAGAWLVKQGPGCYSAADWMSGCA